MEIRRIALAGCDTRVKSKQIRSELVAPVLFRHENKGGDKHVESVLVPCLDAGSTPAISTRTEGGCVSFDTLLFFWKKPR